MLRRLARLLLLMMLAASLATTGLLAARIAQAPGLAPFRVAAAAELRAASDRMLAEVATPQAVAERIETRLAEDPRNWLALEALAALVVERNISLPPALVQRLDAAREDDHSLLAQTASCAVCAYDAAECPLTQVLLCHAPVALTPIGDLAGVTRAGLAYATGEAVDEIDLALSVAGLGATAALLASGGGSVVVKAGAGLAKLARRMGQLSPRLVDMAVQAVRTGVKWAELPGVRSLDELRTVVRAEAFAPLTATLTDLERLRSATDTTTTLHLLPLVDNAAEARALANAADALGPKLVGRAEMLGKARLLRAGLRISDIAWALVSGLSALLLSLAGLIGSAAHHAALRRLRARLESGARR